MFVTALAVALLAPALPAATAAAAKPKLRVTVPAGVPAGGSARIAGRVTGPAPRVVVLQEQVRGRWLVRASGRVGRRGVFTLRWTVPKRTGVRRVRVAGRVRGRAVRSTTRRLQVLRRGGAPGARVVLGASAIAAPARSGAPADVVVRGPVAIDKGDILAAGVTPNTPEGFLGLVTGTRPGPGGTKVVATVPTTLPEAVPDGSFDVSIPDVFTPPNSLRAASSGADDRGRGSIGKRVSCEAGGSVELAGGVKVEVGTKISAHWKWSLRGSGVDRASFVANASAAADLTASAEAAIGCELAATEIAQFNPPAIKFMVGPIPVVLVPKIHLDVAADAKVRTRASTGIHGSISASAGLEFQEGSVKPIHSFNKEFRWDPPAARADAHAAGYVIPRFDLLVYGVAGPQASLKTGLSFDADTDATPWWKLTVPVDLTAKLIVPALGLDSGEWHVYQDSFLLASAGDATPPPPVQLARRISAYETTGDLQCRLATEEDREDEFYTSERGTMNACGTFLVVDGRLFGPETIPAGRELGDYEFWTPVDQTLTGAGTAQDPYVRRTTVAAGDSGVQLTETDTWALGGSEVRSTYDVSGGPGDTREVRVYRAADCYVGDGDVGFGAFDPATQVPGCLRDNGDGTQTQLSLVPEAPGATAIEAYFRDVWSAVAAQDELPGTCRCSDNIDNGFAVSWARRLNGGTPVRLASKYAFVITQ
jgi:hypothetical protein